MLFVEDLSSPFRLSAVTCLSEWRMELRCRMPGFLWHLVINGNITRLRLSEATVTACNMSRLDERFELDAIMLHYIEQDEVYWYGDICEEMGL